MASELYKHCRHCYEDYDPEGGGAMTCGVDGHGATCIIDGCVEGAEVMEDGK